MSVETITTIVGTVLMTLAIVGGCGWTVRRMDARFDAFEASIGARCDALEENLDARIDAVSVARLESVSPGAG